MVIHFILLTLSPYPYTLLCMNDIKKEKLRKKSFWLPEDKAQILEKEAEKNWKSESALMTHIISNWFKK